MKESNHNILKLYVEDITFTGDEMMLKSSLYQQYQSCFFKKIIIHAPNLKKPEFEKSILNRQLNAMITHGGMKKGKITIE